jgi:branched-subunit amino acid transport protein
MSDDEKQEIIFDENEPGNLKKSTNWGVIIAVLFAVLIIIKLVISIVSGITNFIDRNFWMLVIVGIGSFFAYKWYKSNNVPD